MNKLTSSGEGTNPRKGLKDSVKSSMSNTLAHYLKSGKSRSERRAECVAYMVDEDFIEREIRRVINKPEGELSQENLNQVTELGICAKGLKDISRIGKLVNLERLILTNNNISNLEPLISLGKLKFLSLADNKNISDLAPLSKLKALEELELWGCCLDDMKILSKLKKLRELGLNGNLLTTTRSLSDLKNLEWLNLDNNIFLKDLDGLSELKKLTYLSLDETEKLPESEINKIKVSLSDCGIEHD